MPDAYPKICFAFPSAEPTTRVWGAADEVHLEAGLGPSVCELRAPVHEFEKLAGDYAKQGNIELYWSSATVPDVVLKGWSIDHVEDSIAGRRPGDPADAVMEKRLTLTDRRWEFLDWRGGTVFKGLVNRASLDGTRSLNIGNNLNPAGDTYAGLLQCLRQHLQYASELAVLSEGRIPTELNDADSKPRDLKWDGLHVPTEIGRLCEEAETAFLVRTDGTYSIEILGAGDMPTIDPDLYLPNDPMAHRDRRTGTVVVTSAPQRLILQEALSGMVGADNPAEPGWEYVAYDTDKCLYPIRQSGHWWGGGLDDARDLVRSRFSDLSGEVLQLAHASLFKIIRLVGGAAGEETPAKPRSDYLPILTRQGETVADHGAVPRALPVRVLAHAAQLQGDQWVNAETQVPICPFKVDPTNGLITFPSILGKLASSVSRAESLPNYFEPLGAGELTVEFGHESHANQTVDLKPWEDYFTIGYRRETDDTITELTAEELATALNPEAKDIRVINFPQLLAYKSGSTILNETAIKAHALRVATRCLGAIQEPDIFRVIGFHDVSPNGNIPEVTWDLRQGLTTFKYQAYYVSNSRYQDNKNFWGRAKAARGAALAIGDAPRQVAHGCRDYAQPVAEMAGGLVIPPSGTSLVVVEIVGTFNEAGDAWTDFETDGFQEFASATRNEETIYLAAGRHDAATGFIDLAGKKIGYLACGTEVDVPGHSGEHFAGYLVAGTGDDRPMPVARVID
jgi:hypothetical protein